MYSYMYVPNILGTCQIFIQLNQSAATYFWLTEYLNCEDGSFKRTMTNGIQVFLSCILCRKQAVGVWGAVLWVLLTLLF